MTDSVHTIKWTETALRHAEAIPDQRLRRLISQRVDQLAESPEQQGKPLVGELAGFRSVRAVGQRYRIIYPRRAAGSRRRDRRGRQAEG